MRLRATEPLIPKCVWCSCLWISLPSSAACKLAHALRTRTKVNVLGLRPACGICWRSSTAFLYLPSFDVALCNSALSSRIMKFTVPLQSSLLPLRGFCQSAFLLMLGIWMLQFTYDHKFELSWSAGHSSQLVQSKTSLCNWESYWLIHQQANCANNHIHFLLQPVIATLWRIWKVCQIFSSWHMDAFFSLRCCITSNFVCYVLVWFCVVQK